MLDGGLWFADPTCRARFTKPRRVARVELDGFAKCLAGLAWRPSDHSSWHDDTAIVTYDPGFELEVHVADGKLDCIGFSGRGEGVPETPMIAQHGLDETGAVRADRPRVGFRCRGPCSYRSGRTEARRASPGDILPDREEMT